jgi:MFS family permease
MDALGIDEAVMQQRVLIALGGFFVVFFILSPIAGRYVHRGSRRLLPEQDTFALLATAFVIFALSFAVALGLLLRVAPGIEPLPALGISSVSALLVTALTALWVRRTVEHGAARIDQDENSFGVWGEDARKRRKNLRKR